MKYFMEYDMEVVEIIIIGIETLIASTKLKIKTIFSQNFSSGSKK